MNENETKKEQRGSKKRKIERNERKGHREAGGEQCVFYKLNNVL